MNDQQSYYETMYILRPDIAEDEVTNHIDKYNKLLEEFGGTILDSQMRGKRRLAYQIAKHREGIYVQLSHQGNGQHIFKIEKAMRLSEDVIRYMTVKQEGPLPTPRASTKGSTKSTDKENPEKDVSKTLLREDLEGVLATLSPRERDVLRLRYGIDDGRMKTLEEIGQIFDVTRERIRQIAAKALRKLSHPNRNGVLKEYIK